MNDLHNKSTSTIPFSVLESLPIDDFNAWKDFWRYAVGVNVQETTYDNV